MASKLYGCTYSSKTMSTDPSIVILLMIKYASCTSLPAAIPMAILRPVRFSSANS